ncbi:radical SAM protein [Paenibacillus sp. J31TS4]|uniref:SPL family radical SAM protein n=1 Tax=Paenibacillus sp. J31TS4 TaxID=2807195 RepID=UPI001B08B3DC|nr:radical SAM protein [Paenibacillus sp. J31TS4]GIP40096.1 radical SAM protein [Paenibacillus sp. J31TS4]
MKTRISYEPIGAKSVLNPVKAPSMPFSFSVNPYRGCQHGCSFCYARSTHSYLGESADDAFRTHIFLKEGAPEVLRAQLERRARSSRGLAPLGRVAIGTATDPYQPVEAKQRLTRGCLEVLADYGVPASITTRSPLVLRDVDVLKRLPSVTVNISCSTLDRAVWRATEPATPFPLKRLETVRELGEAGIRAGLFLAPVLPVLTDSEERLRDLMEAAVGHGARFVMPSYLRLSTQEVKVWFFQTLEQAYPSLVPTYARLYRQSGYAAEEYRKPKLAFIRSLLKEYGLREERSGDENRAAGQASPPCQTGSEAPAEAAADPALPPDGAPVQLSFTF